MEVVTALAAWAIAATCRTLPASNEFFRSICPRQPSDLAGLHAKLSPSAQIFLPGSTGYANATNRWSTRDAPRINTVVLPGVERDVVETVQYANARNIAYLAVNGGHGAITTLGTFDGIEIWLDQLSTVQVSPDGTTATIGGGTLSKAVIDSLWAEGKQTVTGACECTSLLGPGLGGGHGWLQGRHGLIADQFVSMNIVMADGDLHTIDKDYDPDLWWAMQGAGHNFGIVTSVTSKIYDTIYPKWAYASFIFNGDKVEGLYGATNDHLLKNGTQPVDVINYSFFFSDPSLDPDKPAIMFVIIQEDADAVDPVYTRPFNDLGPLVTDHAAGTYPDLAALTGFSNDALPCQRVGLVNSRFPVDIDTYNVTAQREVYDLFSSAIAGNPTLNRSLVLFEGYSLQGVQSIPSDSTAVPHRAGNLLVLPLITYPPGGPALDKQAADLGTRLRRILFEGSGQTDMHTYVNYAFGDEERENWYGFEPWRLDRLKTLKQKYDPLGKFSFFAPAA